MLHKPGILGVMGLIVLLVVGSTLVGGEWVTSFCFSEVV
jgi:hypothetical protein